MLKPQIRSWRDIDAHIGSDTSCRWDARSGVTPESEHMLKSEQAVKETFIRMQHARATTNLTMVLPEKHVISSVSERGACQFAF